MLSISRLGRMAMATFTGSNQSDSEECTALLKIYCLSLQSILNIYRLFLGSFIKIYWTYVHICKYMYSHMHHLRTTFPNL